MHLCSGNKIVSVVVPCLNEEEAIGGVVRELLSAGADQVLVVDNGSSDRTDAAAREAGATVVVEPVKGYGRACATGLAAIRPDTDIVCFLDGDGSDVPSFLPQIVGPIAADRADFVIGSRLLGQREAGSMSPQQVVAGWVAGALIFLYYRVRFTDMSPFRAMRVADLRDLGMAEMTYGWNLEMQMRVAAGGYRIEEIAVDHRCRRGGVSKVSGNLVAGVSAAWKIMTTFVRLASSLPRQRGRRTFPVGAAVSRLKSPERS
ncbi:MAG: glycosyltransferase family 2 protein [Xanthobacteraceae bacterium]|nr:glycosyltransferase family 2 protein [Xanthobacteraceae bacterium]